MVSPNDYIIITESRDLGEEPANSGNKYQEEPESASHIMLESQGISILGKDEDLVPTTKPRDQFSRELMNEGGVEIVASDDDESFL
ncbi:MAG: hypothetical protein A2747_02250 [Candidatus Yonathbacteria bacterium RIFCSPHIGHO2_01_FULL_44_41]|uniref:Uncharacterized protein n=1 Tax=Candidatus Yonathbacteria bacterium RIFCSPHIGHO2_02_FULL_44_14 TaxID=1802724 RepID=A0A1G2S8Q6_9BACT|nr:MAG: hypothetical protein A2747_02250 [Candidatus Yonathbacteria bacterium RIFCSPHIGHO2_01_FULL_44_41]OHA81387.1 MAG: hypothetical protein A3D51_03165 [Candidatus Yonathbacteria bacterium RIFCSPHIGHO2_02_FULL_44_14]OHA82049.1 MAG: hypothetical protein A3B06_00850 [Candidatus Yonathbacteria bacterium RIFCSPLOWO2_01_FULL_43_20]